jgi:hypothetical protein
MTINRLKALILAIASVAAISSQAQVIDKLIPGNPLSLGVRVGANSSVITNNFPYADNSVKSSNTSWKAGFTAGVVADLKFRNYFAIQPGLFFESRNMDYSTVNFGDYGDAAHQSIGDVVDGHVRSYRFTVPILASFRFNLTPLLQLRAEAGPYFSFGVGGTHKYTTTFSNGDAPVTDKDDSYGDDGMRKYDWGLKTGVEVVIFKTYSVGVHYMAGFRNVYHQPEDVRHDIKGHNKAWTVTLGYTLF